MAYIELKNVTKVIAKRTVLQNITLNLEQGKIYGFVGANGSGKTMLFRALLGFIKTEGSIKIADQKIDINQDLPVNTGVIIETPIFISNYTAMENLRYLASFKKIASDKEIDQALAVFDLDKEKDLKVKKFSLGMRQKLAIVQSFMEGQVLLVLDEPTNGLDEDAVAVFKNLVLKLKSEGKTILISSHDKTVVNDICDTIYQMSDGKISND